MTIRSSRSPVNALALLAGVFAAAIPKLSRAAIAGTLHDIGKRIANKPDDRSLDAHFTLASRFNEYALLLSREALMRGYVTDEQTKPSLNGIQAEVDAVGDDETDANTNTLLALLAKQVSIVGDAVALSTSGSDTGVTRFSLAQYLRDLANDGREEDVGMYDIVNAANPVFDRAIEAEFITEGEVQGATVLFEDDREGGFKYLAYIADSIEKANTMAAVA